MDTQTKKQLKAAIENDLIIYPIVKDAFEQADKNKNGFIERTELESCMLEVATKLGVTKPDREAINAEFKKLDVNKDGVIDIKEFQKFIRKNLLTIVDEI